MRNETKDSIMENETDVSVVKEMLESWLENGARDKETIQAFRKANLIPRYVFKQAKIELGVLSFLCPIKESWMYVLPSVRRCDGCGKR